VGAQIDELEKFASTSMVKRKSLTFNLGRSNAP